MEIKDILHELEQNRGYFPREAIEAAIQRREEIVPHLLSALRDAARHTPESIDEKASFLPLYAIFLLAQFREPRAHPLILDLCKLPREVLDILIGDTITEGLGRIIASVFDGNISVIKSVVESPSVDEYVRGSALRSLSTLVYTGTLTRDDVIAYFAELFRGKLEKEYSHVWDVLASESVDLYAKSLVGDIRAAYDEGLLSTGYMQPREVDQSFAQPEERVLIRSKERYGRLIDDVVKEMHWWHCFKPRKALKSKPSDISRNSTEQYYQGTVVRTDAKVCRNAPCPCGSGKKYKKCCGNGSAAP